MKINSIIYIHILLYSIQICKYCNISQPVRSHHCKYCNKCVKVYDHHCAVIGTCIGERNHGRFLLYLLCETVIITYAFIIIIIGKEKQHNSYLFSSHSIKICGIILAIVFYISLYILMYIVCIFISNSIDSNSFVFNVSEFNNL